MYKWISLNVHFRCLHENTYKVQQLIKRSKWLWIWEFFGMHFNQRVVVAYCPSLFVIGIVVRRLSGSLQMQISYSLLRCARARVRFTFFQLLFSCMITRARESKCRWKWPHFYWNCRFEQAFKHPSCIGYARAVVSVWGTKPRTQISARAFIRIYYV